MVFLDGIQRPRMAHYDRFSKSSFHWICTAFAFIYGSARFKLPQRNDAMTTAGLPRRICFRKADENGGWGKQKKNLREEIKPGGFEKLSKSKNPPGGFVICLLFSWLNYCLFMNDNTSREKPYYTAWLLKYSHKITVGWEVSTFFFFFRYLRIETKLMESKSS